MRNNGSSVGSEIFGSPTLKIRYFLTETKVRTAISDFTWGISTASIPGVVLTSVRRQNAAEKMASLFDVFR